MAKVENVRLDKIVHSDTETGYYIIRVVRDKNNISSKDTDPLVFNIKGYCKDLSIFADDFKRTSKQDIFLDAEGHWEKSSRYGVQFVADKIILKKNLTKFLTDYVNGVGPRTVQKLVSFFGETALEDILDNHPERLSEYRGISGKRAQKIIVSWREHTNTKERELSEFFYLYGVNISSSDITRICNYFKEIKANPVDEIRKNPYCLLDIKDFSFRKVDKIAVQIGIDYISPVRMKALTDYLLFEQAKEYGHTYVLIDKLADLAYRYMFDSKTIGNYSEKDVLSAVVDNIFLHNESYYVEVNKVAKVEYYQQEKFIKDNIEKRLANKTPLNLSDKQIDKFIKEEEDLLSRKYGIKVELDEKQKEAVKIMAKDTPHVFLLCGYAGTGKTTVTRVLLDLLKKYANKKRIVTCALSGMVAKRIHSVTEYDAQTIHSLLGFVPDFGSFRFNANNQLPNDVVLITESSMINLYMFYSLLRAIRNDAFVIIVGDDAQLPPIGEGNVFNGLLNQDSIPKVVLSTVHRQGQDSAVSYFASLVRQGVSIEKDQLLGNYTDFEFIELPVAQANRALVDKVKSLIKAEHLVSVDDKVSKLQVISQVKTKTNISIAELNKVFQDELNDSSVSVVVNDGNKLKLYDKVIHIKDQDMPFLFYKFFKDIKPVDAISQYKLAKARILNGSIGYVISIDSKNKLFYVRYDDIYTEPIVVQYAFDEFKEIIDLGYTVTVHEARGSQFDYVFMLIFDNVSSTMLNNRILYTVLTRARKKITFIGDSNAFIKASKNAYMVNRNTFLSEMKIKVG